jgi:nitroreductase
MTRAFDPARAVEPAVLERLVDLASRAPSAGKTQGWHLVVLQRPETGRFWDITLPPAERASFAWPGLLDAPVVALVLADPDAYVARYAEPDKAAAGLGESAEAWPVPYWTVDAAFATMTLLLAAEAEGLGTLFFGVFQGEDELRTELGIPGGLLLLGVVALGWPAPQPARPGTSASRPRRRPAEIIHQGRW